MSTMTESATNGLITWDRACVWKSPRWLAAAALAALWPAIAWAAEPATDPTQTGPESLHVGILLDYTGPLGVHGEPTEAGIRLAVEHVNAAGGVLGRPVRLTVADGETDPAVAAARARELVGQGVHALIGPAGSAATLAVSEAVSGPLRIATVTPSATSPDLTAADDADFLFRTVLSDAAQGEVLATLAAREGLQRLGVIYQPDSYGNGLLRTFEASFEGELVTFEVAGTESSYLPTLRAMAQDDAEALVLFTYLGVAEKVLQEAMAADLFERYLAADAITTADLALNLDATKPGQITATGPGGAGPGHSASQIVAGEMQETLGHAPQSAALSAYDATICVCLAAEHAGSPDPEAIRDSLRQVCGGGGLDVGPGSAGVREALAAIRSAQAIDYDGAASAVDWDEAGDVTDGFVGVYRFQSGAPTLVERIRFGG